MFSSAQNSPYCVSVALSPVSSPITRIWMKSSYLFNVTSTTLLWPLSCPVIPTQLKNGRCTLDITLSNVFYPWKGYHSCKNILLMSQSKLLSHSWAGGTLSEDFSQWGSMYPSLAQLPQDRTGYCYWDKGEDKHGCLFPRSIPKLTLPSCHTLLTYDQLSCWVPKQLELISQHWIQRYFFLTWNQWLNISEVNFYKVFYMLVSLR